MNKVSPTVTIDDPLMGKLEYHKSYVYPPQFDGRKYLCHHPFVYMEVRRYGSLSMCCPQWNPVEIGNIFQSSLEEIWNGERARVMRQTILDGSYKYCNIETCPRIQQQILPLKTSRELTNLLNRLKASRTPEAVHFVVDHSCNLSCPSCRIERISQLIPSDQDIGYKTIKKVLDSMFSIPHNEHKELSMDGSGEIFSSELYRKLFETHPVFVKPYDWPNLRFRLTTNGTMMTEKIQRKYHYMFNSVASIDVSIDAGDEDSYKKVRVGGHWDLLWKNLHYFYENTLKTNENKWWRWNIIMQKNNFRSLPQFIKLAKQFPDRLPRLQVNPILNWYHMSEEMYLQHAVHLPTHPEHQDYLSIMQDHEVIEYLKNHA